MYAIDAGQRLFNRTHVDGANKPRNLPARAQKNQRWPEFDFE
jgi:hypothetical protein